MDVFIPATVAGMLGVAVSSGGGIAVSISQQHAWPSTDLEVSEYTVYILLQSVAVKEEPEPTAHHDVYAIT
jgi:hypothetical protein